MLEVMADCRLMFFLREPGDLRIPLFIGYSGLLFLKVHLVPLAQHLAVGITEFPDDIGRTFLVLDIQLDRPHS